MKSCNYFGAKAAIAPWINQYLPHHTSYLEPFCGSAAVLINKGRAAVEVINDLHAPVINFLQWVQRSPQQLVQVINEIPQNSELAMPFCHCWSLYEAAHFFHYSERSWAGGGTRHHTGYGDRQQVDPSHLWRVSERLQGVQILHGDGFELLEAIASQPGPRNLLIYCDPPYDWEARKSKDSRHKNPKSSAPRRQYAHELSQADHRRLRELLEGQQAIVSSYGGSESLYRFLYDGWQVVSKRHAGDRECLWISPQAAANLPQLSLFSHI